MRQASQLSSFSFGSLGSLSQVHKFNFSRYGELLQSFAFQLDGMDGRGGRSEGFRIAKTKITSTYKMPKRRAYPMD